MVSRLKKFTSYHAILHFLISMALVSMVIVSIVGYFFLKRNYIKTISSHSDVTLTTTITNITNYLQAKQQTSGQIAAMHQLIQFVKNPTTPLSVEFQKKMADFTSATLIFSAEHTPLFVSDKKLNALAANGALQESIQRSMILVYPDLSDFVIDPETQMPHLFITTPLISENQFIGTLATEIDLKAIQHYITNYTDLGDTGEIIVTKNRDHSIVTLLPTRFDPQASFKPLKAEKTPYYETFIEANNGHRGTLITRDEQHQKTFLTWQYMPLTQWGFTLKQAYRETAKPLLFFKIFMGIIVALCSLLFFYFLYKSWLHARKTMPLDKIFAKTLLSLVYLLFICNTALLMLYLANSYYEQSMLRQKDTLLFKGALQKAAQMVDYRIATVEMVANALAIDVTNSELTAAALPARLQLDLQENPDLNSIIYARKKNSGWEITTCSTEPDKKSKIIHTQAQQTPEWIQKALANQAAWLLIQRPAQDSATTQPEPVYSVQFYDQQDFEQKSPLGFVSIVYHENALINLAQQKMGGFPFMLILPDGTIAYQDKTLAFKPATVNVTNNQNKNLYLEKMTHLGWYIASVSQGTPYTPRQILVFLLKIIALICSIVIATYSFARYAPAQRTQSNNKTLIYACLLTITFTSIFYLCNFFIK